jgi:hypothetical protein
MQMSQSLANMSNETEKKSETPITDKTWDLHNRGKCGLHYIAYKMREIEQENARLREVLRTVTTQPNTPT